jgi:hypothetical protein
MEKNNFVSDDWVDQQLASLAVPDREPNTDRALAALKMRTQNRQATLRRWVWTAMAASVVCAALLSMPRARGLAQALWDRLFLSRVDVARVNFRDVPETLHLDVFRGYFFSEDVGNPDEAERKAGFRPKLPPAGIFAGPPRLSVNPKLEAGLTVRRAELSAALAKAGVSGVELPPEWEGASVRMELGPILNAEYGDGTSVLQCPPFMLATTPGFDTTRFLEVFFRILGLDASEASRMRSKFAANPAWFWGIPRGQQATIQEVSLRSGSGIYIEEFDARGARGEADLIWGTLDRIYLVTGKQLNRERALAVANAIP